MEERKQKFLDDIMYPGQKKCFELAIHSDDVAGANRVMHALYDLVTYEVGSAKEDATDCGLAKTHLQCPHYDVFMKAKWTETYLRMKEHYKTD